MNIQNITVKTVPAQAAVSCHTERTAGSTDGVSTLRVRASVADGTLDATEAICLTLSLENDIRACMADVLYTPHWCRPAFFTSPAEAPKNTQALLWQYTDGSYGAILPICADGFISTLQGQDGALTLTVTTYEGNTALCDTTAAVFGRDTDPYRLLSAMAAEASTICHTPLRGARAYPEVFEYLGWCSWDAMEIWVNEGDLLKKCAELRDGGVPVRWVILDDMWAQVDWARELPPFTSHTISFPTMHASKLHHLEADPARFPKGLAHTVSEIKKFDLEVGIWHPVTGYWAGLTEGSPAHAALAPYVHTVKDRIYPDLRDEQKVYGFYSTWHRFLKDCGVSFMKIDNQSFLRQTYTDTLPLGDAAKNMHRGLERSVNEHFGGALINCMGMASENMLSRPCTAISRCSGDFQPENRAWFTRHILQCAYNGLFQGQFFYNDWDMFWTDDTQALRNSVVHAVSGGPIYVSDKLQRTRAEVLTPLCLPDGRILRCDEVAVPARAWLCDNPTQSDRAFALINRADETVYYAAFNLHAENAAVGGSLTPRELGFTEDVVLYEYFSGTGVRLHSDQSYTFTLPDNDAVLLFSLTPYRGCPCVIGLSEKMIAAKTWQRRPDGGILPRCDGTLVVYSETPIVGANSSGKSLYRLPVRGGQVVDPLS